MLVAVLVLLVSACGDGGIETVGTSGPVRTTVLSTACSDVDFRARIDYHSRAQAGELAPAMPPVLGQATAAIPSGLLTGLVYAGCSAEFVEGLRYAQMMWTNGPGVLSVSWQEWPDDGPLGTVPLGGDSYQAGVVQVSYQLGMPALGGDEVQTQVVNLDDGERREITVVGARERTQIVNLYDGMKVITVVSYSLTTLSLEQVEKIAWAVYDGLPVPATDRDPSDERILDDLLLELPSDLVSVSGLQDVADLSPFTENLGMATITRSFIAGGSTLLAYDFGAPGATDRAAASISSDGFTIAHQAYGASGIPRFWRWDRVIVLYTEDDLELLGRLVEVMGEPFAGQGVLVDE